jgi:hypothetical protein
MHGSVPLFIGMGYNFDEFTIVPLNIYIQDTKHIEGNVVFSFLFLDI